MRLRFSGACKRDYRTKHLISVLGVGLYSLSGHRSEIGYAAEFLYVVSAVV